MTPTTTPPGDQEANMDDSASAMTSDAGAADESAPDTTSDGASTGERAHASDGDKQSFRLLDLPDELWSKIGKMAIDEVPQVHTNDMICACQGHAASKRQPNITKACKALRKELLPYFYGTRFDISVGHRWDFEDVSKWLEAIGPDNRRCLNGVSVKRWIGRSVPCGKHGDIWPEEAIKFLEASPARDEDGKLGLRKEPPLPVKFI